MKKEEERLQNQKPSGNSKSRSRAKQMTYILSLAAVLVVLVIIPISMGLPGGEVEINKGLYAQKTTPEIFNFQGNSDEQSIEKQDIKMTEVSEIPSEFTYVNPTEAGEYTYSLLQEKNGDFKAYVQMGEKGYLFTSDIQDKATFLQEMEALLPE